MICRIFSAFQASSLSLFVLLALLFGNASAQVGKERLPGEVRKEGSGEEEASEEEGQKEASEPPEWEVRSVEFEKKEEGTVRVLQCKDCELDGRGLPVRSFSKKLGRRGMNVQDVELELTGLQFEPLSEEERNALGELADSLPSRIEAEQRVVYSRKVPYLKASFVPLIRKASGEVRKLVDHEISVGGIERGASASASRAASFASHSVLRNGEWYRIGVTESGVHRIDREVLGSLGIDADSIDPSSIDVYGNCFGMLPFRNDRYRPDDLKKLSIDVEAGSDGSFDPGDRAFFYAKGPDVWRRDPASGDFGFRKHLYTDTAWYFLRLGSPSPSRVQKEGEVSDPVDETVEAVNVFSAHEKEKVNLIHSGRQWAGERIESASSRSFKLLEGRLEPGSEARVQVRCLARTLGNSNASSFRIDVNGATSGNLTIQGVKDHYLSKQGRFASTQLTHSVGSNENGLRVELSFQGNSPSSRGWLDRIVVNAERELELEGDQMSFRDTSSVGPGKVVRFRFQGSSRVDRIWDVSAPRNPRSIPFDMAGGSPRFEVHADSLRHFVAFDREAVSEPVPGGKVPEQDLHAAPQPDMVILSGKDLVPAARELAEFHRSEGMDVLVTTPRKVYNEFGGGMRDITAIKDLMRMFYERAGTDSSSMPDHLLLFGDGSFDNRLPGMDEKWIPTFQSANSISPSRSYTSDDYYGLLDSNEGKSTSDLVDIGIGRIPVTTLSQARGVVSKIEAYSRNASPLASGQHCGPGESSLQDPNWRDLVVFIADDEDNNLHMRQADDIAGKVRSLYPVMNQRKLFLDAFQQTRASGGERYPDVNQRINERMERGALIMNYVGHGGERGLAKERILTQKMIKEWENLENMPVFITATCEFTRFDDHSLVSAGENVLLNENGGGIGLLSTTRVVYASQNKRLNEELYNHLLDKENGKPLRLGEVVRRTKVEMTKSTPSAVNHRKFLFFGDPALRLNMPNRELEVDSIDSSPVGSPMDTVQALSEVSVSGSVLDRNGSMDGDFEGIVHPLVMDKRQNIETLANDGGSPMTFQVFNSWLYRGKASVEDGKFEFEFVVPKDIAYQFGNGRISLIAKGEGSRKDAHGYTEEFIIGGTDSSARKDEKGPDIGIHMNDKDFVPGGTTDEDPLMIAELKDKSGINISSSGIGHNIKAILDGDRSDAVTLNEHYRSDLDTYRKGEVKYRFQDLEEGQHELTLKAWDVHNNPSERKLDFVVANSAELALDHVLNYPNPFTTHTEFFFEHNQACNYLNVRIRIFTVSGQVVETIQRRVHSEGFRSEGIAWDGTDRFGDALGKGVYVYELTVETPEGKKANKFEKLVLLK